MLTISAPAAAADADEVVAESTPPPNDWYRNRLSVGVPLEVERIELAKPPAVSSECGHAALCIGRELGDGFVHNGLNDSSDHAWARGSRGGQLDERERGDACDLTVYTLLLLLLRLAIGRDAEWSVGVTCLVVAGRACRSIRRWESNEWRERHAELYEGFLLLHSPIEDAGTGHHQTAARVCGDIDASRLCVCVFVFVFVPLALVVVRLGVCGWEASSCCLPANGRGEKFGLDSCSGETSSFST